MFCQVFWQEMSADREMIRTGIAERAQAGRSPPLRRRRTREYIPNSRSSQRQGYPDQNLHDNSLFTDELSYGARDVGGHLYPDENMNTLSRSSSENQQHLQDILRVMPEGSHLNERYQILKAENKILRERLQNALQREMKALKTFKRLAKENRQLKLNLRKYERTLLGFYDDESGKWSMLHLLCWTKVIWKYHRLSISSLSSDGFSIPTLFLTAWSKKENRTATRYYLSQQNFTVINVFLLVCL